MGHNIGHPSSDVKLNQVTEGTTQPMFERELIHSRFTHDSKRITTHSKLLFYVKILTWLKGPARGLPVLKLS